MPAYARKSQTKLCCHFINNNYFYCTAFPFSAARSLKMKQKNANIITFRPYIYCSVKKNFTVELARVSLLEANGNRKQFMDYSAHSVKP